MSVALLSLILLGNGLAIDSGQPIGYQVKVHEMEGLEWRSSVHARLTQIDRPGRATVWVAPKDTASEIAGKASRVLFAPKMVGEGGISGSVRQTTEHPYIADLTREANGPVDQATALMFKPTMDYWQESLAVEAHCQRMPTGVLTAVKLEESHLISMVTYNISEQVKLVNATGQVQLTRLNGQIQVPEVATGQVDGEWLIPHEHTLIVSLGIHTVLRENKPVVTERVAVITPEPSHVLPVDSAPADKAMTLAATPPNTPLGGKKPLNDRKKVAPPLPIGESGQWVASASPPAAPSAATSVSPIVINAPTQGAIVVIIPAQGQGTAELVNLALNTLSAKPAPEPEIQSTQPAQELAPDAAPPPPDTATLPSASSPPPDSVPPPPAAPADATPAPVTPDPPVSPFADKYPVPTDPVANFAPPLPSVSLPLALDADGNVIALPPGDDTVLPVGLPGEQGPALPSPSSPAIPSGPDAFSLAPTYHAQRTIRITGTFHDGQGWKALSESKSGADTVAGKKAASATSADRLHACDSGEEQLSEGAEQAGTLSCPKDQVSTSILDEIRQRLTTSLGIAPDGEVIRVKDLTTEELPAPAPEADSCCEDAKNSVTLKPHRPTFQQFMGYSQACSISTEIATALMGEFSAALPVQMSQVEIGTQIMVHLQRCGRQPVVFLGTAPVAYRDIELARTSDDGAATPVKPMRAIGMVVGNQTFSVRDGQFPGTTRVRLPIGGLLAVEFRNDVRPAECRTLPAAK